MFTKRVFIVLGVCLTIVSCSGEQEQTDGSVSNDNLLDDISTGESSAQQCDVALGLYSNTVKVDMQPCMTCHVTTGIAASTQLILNETDSLSLSGISFYQKQFGSQALLDKTIGLPSHVGGAVFVDASSQQYSNLNSLLMSLDACNDVVPTVPTVPVVPVVPVVPAPDNSLSITRGEALWVSLSCASCHGDIGDGIPQGSTVIPSLSRTNVVQVTADTMPFGNVAACDLTCSEDIVAYLRFVNSIEVPVDNGGSTPIDNTPVVFTEKQLLKQLYKASMNLLSRVPDQRWIDSIKNQQQAGLRTSVDEMLNDSSFYARLREIYTPLLVSPDRDPPNAYATMFNGDMKWFEEYSGDTSTYARNQIRLSTKQEPLRLIEYVVKNDKPFTEILTADYALLNYYSARALNQLSNVQFQTLTNPENATFPYSVDEYKRVDISSVPLAGVLTSNQFMQKYPTTSTNVNRHRAYNVYKIFLDTDIFEISGSRVTTDDLNVSNPTLNNPSCTGCHNVLDPVSSSFRHWQRGTERRADYTRARWNQNGILVPGLNGQIMPDNEPAPLQWLANEMAMDKRFSVATVKTFFTEITGYSLLIKPNDTASALDINRYDSQQNFIRTLADDFISSAYNLKFLIAELIKSDFFYGSDFNGGSSQLLPVDRLKRKILTTTGVDSFSSSRNLLNRNVYQGKQTSGIMSLIQRYSASYISCLSVAPDMAKVQSLRVLLPEYDLSATPFDANGLDNVAVHLQIKQNIKNLMWVLWGDYVEVDDPELLTIYEIYINLLSVGLTDADRNISNTCDAVAADGSVIRADDDYQIRAWIGIVNLMIDDFRFLYE